MPARPQKSWTWLKSMWVSSARPEIAIWRPRQDQSDNPLLLLLLLCSSTCSCTSCSCSSSTSLLSGFSWGGWLGGRGREQSVCCTEMAAEQSCTKMQEQSIAFKQTAEKEELIFPVFCGHQMQICWSRLSLQFSNCSKTKIYNFTIMFLSLSLLCCAALCLQTSPTLLN